MVLENKTIAVQIRRTFYVNVTAGILQGVTSITELNTVRLIQRPQKHKVNHTQREITNILAITLPPDKVLSRPMCPQ